MAFHYTSPKAGRPDAVRSRGHASAILDRVMTRRDLRLATPKQLFWLRRTGHKNPETASFDEATAWLSTHL